MKKILSIIILISFISSKVFSQEKINEKVMHQRDSALPMNTVHTKNIKSSDLSEKQKLQIKKIKNSFKAREAAIKNNSSLTQQQKKAQLAKLRKERQIKLQSVLTREQRKKQKIIIR